MFSLPVTLTLALASLVGINAIQVTSPGTTTAWAIGGQSSSETVTWDSVSTDPTTFAMILVNQNSAYLSSSVVLDDNVTTSDNTADVTFPNGGWPTGTSFQINFIKSSNEQSTIYAQSGMFNITESTTTSSSSSSASSSAADASTSAASSSAATSAASTTSAASAASSTVAASGTSSYTGNGIPSSSSSASSGAFKSFQMPVVPALMALGGIAIGGVVLGA